MLYALIIIHWLHVVLAIAWFGSAMYRVFVTLPALAATPAGEQRATLKREKERADALILVVGLLVIGLGIVRGTVVGPIQTADVWLTPYGLTWTIGLVLALTLFGWELFVLGAATELFIDDEDIPVGLDAGKLTLRQASDIRRIRTLATIELAGFAAIFTCMILMRFGY